MKKDRKIKLYEEFSYDSLDSILDSMDDVLDGKITHDENNTYYEDIVKDLDAVGDRDKIEVILKFIEDHHIGNFEDGSDECNALIKVFNSGKIDISFADYLLITMLYYRGLEKNKLVTYLLENFTTDPNSEIALSLLSMTTYSKYNDLFGYITGREGFDPSYRDSVLLPLCIDAEKIDYVKILLQDVRIDPNVIRVVFIDHAASRNNIELLELLLKHKTEYSETDMAFMARMLMHVKHDIFKIIVDKANMDLSFRDNTILKKLLDYGMPNEIKHLISKGSVMKTVDYALMSELIKNGYLPSYKKRKIKID